MEENKAPSGGGGGEPAPNNDLGRILANFTRAIPQELIIMPTGAVLPKR